MATRAEARLLGVVAACFLLSGAGSLVLETVWQRELRLLFGSSTLAVSTILVTYMLGLGLGSLLGGRLSSRMANGVRVYGWLELGVALYALAVPLMIRGVGHAAGGALASFSFWPVTLARFFGSLALMLVPTLAMGATLPVLVETCTSWRPAFGRHVGLLYGINTAGAVLGVLTATFVLFPRLGLAWSNRAGAALDAVAGMTALALLGGVSGTRSRQARAEGDAGVPPGGNRGWFWVGVVSYGLVGFTALVYEVAWTRVLSMTAGSSIYAFAAMLTAFLAGIALGSLAVRRWADRLSDPWPVYGVALIGLGVTAGATEFLFPMLPDAYVAVLERAGLAGRSMVVAGFVLSAAVMLPATLVLGALFPLACRVVARSGAGRTVAAAYFSNTLGSASGAFAAGFLLVPWLGLRNTVAAAAAANLLCGASILAARRTPARALRPLAAAGAAAALALWVVPAGDAAAELTRGVYYVPENEIDFGIEREKLEGVPGDRILFYRDGLAATVSVHDTGGGLNLRVNGKPDASIWDMSTQVLIGQIPMVFGRRPEDVLVIGYGSGISAGAAALHRPRRLDIVEIEGAVLEAARLFDAHNHRPLDRPFTRVIVEDGRNYVAHTKRRYDAIISEPSNPWMSGASNLFTREFFREARRALRPGGKLLQWIHFYGMDEPTVLSVFRAITDEFPHVYGFLYTAEDTDFLMLATDRPLGPDDLPRWERLDPEVRADFDRIGIGSTEELWSLLRADDRRMAELAARASAENTDDSMYVELRAPWSIYAPEDARWRRMLGRTASIAG
ncbi:MAG: hypothetical protein D6718_11675, partial [Acidobacteria bacterium]